MEELQSTEILDREILEDARKKARNVLKSADEEVKAKTAEWEQKTAASLEELRLKYEKQTAMAVRETRARLPVEKQRAKAKALIKQLHSAVDAWYKGLDRSRVCALLENELRQKLKFYEGFSGGQVKYFKLEKAEVQKILGAVLPGKNFTYEEVASNSEFSEFFIEDDQVRIIASIEKSVNYFLEEKRAHLCESLLGDKFGEGL